MGRKKNEDTLSPGRIDIAAIGAYAGAVALCVAILVWVLNLWNADLAIPFSYLQGGDAFSHSSLVKGLIENNWYLHNRFVGMPAGLDFHDYPLVENGHFLLIKLMSLWSSDYALIMNLFFLLTFPLTVLTSLFVFRRFNLSYPPAIVGSVLFAFLPYHLRRGEFHLFLASYYQIPLTVMVILWVWRGEPLFRFMKDTHRPDWVRSKVTASIAICILAASAGAYYAFFAGFFLLVAGIHAFFRDKTPGQFLAIGILIAVFSLTLVVNLSPRFIYAYQHGNNSQLIRRSPVEAEFFGMKIIQVLLPVSGHRVPSLTKLKEAYNRRGAPFLVNGENDSASIGLIGAIGFLMLIAWLVAGTPKVRNAELFNGLSVLNTTAVLLATIGGFGTLLAFVAVPEIRAYNRISVFIAFFSLFAVMLFLDNLSQRWGEPKTGSWLMYGLLGLILSVGILDQTGPGLVPAYTKLKAEYSNDGEFVKRIEASVPKEAMIFQLPYVTFPESPPVQRMRDYDLLRGYLHSKTLRWSYGAMRGRMGDLWQGEVAAKPLDEMLGILALAGFSGIYIDRYGYSDQAVGLEAKLSGLLNTKPINSANQRMAFFNMANFVSQLRNQYTPEEWQLRRDAVLHPLRLQWKGGFSKLEGTADNHWRWCSSEGELHIDNPRERKVIIEMVLKTGYRESSNMRIDSPWFSEKLEISVAGRFFSKEVTIPPGSYTIQFKSDARRIHAPPDPRVLVFRVVNFHLAEVR
jgi:phosphoglycerol transferase